MGAVRDEEGGVEPVLVEQGADVANRLQGRAAGRLGEDGARGHVSGFGVAALGGCLGDAVAGKLAARDNEPGRIALLVQVDGVIEARRQHRGRTAVVLGRAEDDDGVHGPAVVLLAHLPDAVDREGGQPDATDDEGHCDERQIPNARLPGHWPWHFLYFLPEPHQQWSLRPMRTPAGE